MVGIDKEKALDTAEQHQHIAFLVDEPGLAPFPLCGISDFRMDEQRLQRIEHLFRQQREKGGAGARHIDIDQILPGSALEPHLTDDLAGASRDKIDLDAVKLGELRDDLVAHHRIG